MFIGTYIWRRCIHIQFTLYQKISSACSKWEPRLSPCILARNIVGFKCRGDEIDC